ELLRAVAVDLHRVAQTGALAVAPVAVEDDADMPGGRALPHLGEQTALIQRVDRTAQGPHDGAVRPARPRHPVAVRHGACHRVHLRLYSEIAAPRRESIGLATISATKA